MEARQAKFNSSDYWAAVQLRREVLRLPLGLDFTGAELSMEESQTHWVIQESDLIIASATVVWPPSQEESVKVRQVAVADTRQGQGLGRKIMLACQADAQRSGFERIALHARESAVPFYLSLGYVLVGDPFEEVGIPHRKMTKDLATI